MFDEFDDFFNFSPDSDYDPTRDDTKGADYKTDIDLDFLEAINGSEKEINLDKRIICHACKGRRADMSKTPRRCFESGGRGFIIGNYGIRKKCPKCDGCGCQVKNYCDECEGIGVQRITVVEHIYLPKGIKDGQKIKLH